MSVQGAEGTRGAIVFDGVCKQWQGRAAVADVSLKLKAGSFTTFIGPSGCGKSTLLSLVAGLDEPSAGYVFVSGRQTSGPTADTASLFQAYNLFPWMTALDNVAFALENLGRSRKQARLQAGALLERVGLKQYAERIPAELSGGMKQRVALVRAFALKPAVLLLDEPFAALDHQTRRLMQAYLLTTWRDTSATVVMVTHDLDEALALADRVVLMSGSPGRIVEVLDIDEPRPRDPNTASLKALRNRLGAHLEREAVRNEFSAEEWQSLAQAGAFALPSEEHDTRADFR
jgi:NitT/TauT family transport system ATP-binding protein